LIAPRLRLDTFEGRAWVGVTPFVSGDLKLLSRGRAQNVSEPLSVFFLKI
jgi:uncharacterized protein YqjF (DUF2071 family)